MMPVLLTNTSSGSQPISAAARSVIVSASATPREPVAQLALPELTIIPRSRPFSRCRRLTESGAAWVWLVVNIPTAAAGRSEASSARSGRPDSLMPAVVAPALKPSGAVTAPTLSISVISRS